jgi:regulator of sigma E protease
MPQILINILAFVCSLGVIIFVHELGHLLLAKAFDVRVLTFSLGFGKRLGGWRRGETDYRVSLVPLGGYVRLGGENPEEASGDPREFVSKPHWQRILIYLAGPTMNVLLSVVVIAGLFMVGIEVPGLQDVPPVVGAVEEASPGAAAGLRPGDRIVAVDGKKVEHWEEVRFALLTSPEAPVELTVARGDETLTTTVTPARVPRYEFGDAGVFPKLLPRVWQVLPGHPAAGAGFRPGDEVRKMDGRTIGDSLEFIAYIEENAGRPVTIEVMREGRPRALTVVPAPDAAGKGKIGVVLGYRQRFGPAQAFAESLRYNWRIVEQTFAVLRMIVSGELAAKSALSGPIEIAALSGAAARTGIRHFFHLMGLISISIAILNLLPIPVLDGGQIFILLVESVMRRDLSLRVKERINQVGFVLIVMLMVMVLYFDIVKNLPAGLLPGT